MKAQPWRRQLGAYAQQGELQPRTTDVDNWQHLNNVALISLQAEAQQRWLLGPLGDAVWRSSAPTLAMQHSATDFLAEAHYPAPLATGVRLLDADAQGLRLASALFQHGHCVGLHQATFCHWVDGRPAPLPAELVARLQAAGAAQAASAPALPADAAAAAAIPASASAPAPAAAPAHPDAWPWQIAMASRFADGDGQRHTSDHALARCAEQGRVQFLTRVFGGGRHAAPVGFMVAHVALHWLVRRSTPPAAHAWQLGIGVQRVGARSLTVDSVLFDAATPVALTSSVMVVIDQASRRPTALPEAARAALSPYLLHR